MVKNKWDKSSNCDRAISNKEIMAWDVFKQSLRMDEPIRSNGNLFFSHDNGCQGDEKMLAHLNRIYP
jgi:hypothetical protein